MTLEELQQQHQQQWDQYYKEREKRQAELVGLEYDIIDALDHEQDRIPHSLRKRLDKDWQQFEATWGDNGSKATRLIQKQKKEMAAQRQVGQKSGQPDAKYFNHPDDAFQYEHLSGREKEWAELQHDHKAIEDLYRAWGKDIPKATRNRMKKHIENYKREHGIPFEPDESLNPKTEKDFALYMDIHEIYRADFAISQSYEIVPDSTNDRLRADITEYLTMAEVYYAMKHENSFTSKIRDKFYELKERFAKPDKQQGKAENNKKDKTDSRREAFRARQQNNRKNETGIDMD